MKKLSHKEIRKVFLDYFESKGHKVVESSPLVPYGDPTLLFTTAGMVQFKPYYSREIEPPFTRATSVQKCLRAGGKDSDLENVGRTPRHHTFFEMLGNFSFGDYFKKEAIEFAWEFVIDVVEMDKERIWITIYEDDDEAFDLWNKHIGVPSQRIVRMDAKSNFWGPAGAKGPCGPCSELYIDLRDRWHYDEKTCTSPANCDGFLEFWNLVFMQFFQDVDGSRSDLEHKGIDTGMGLERLALILQEKESVYETDVFSPIIQRISELSEVPYDGLNKVPMNVVADHIRAITFVMSEEVIPSNEGRGYVLRRIIRRALRYARKVGLDHPFLHKVVHSVVEAMGDVYPEIKEKEKYVAEQLKVEEERFFRTLSEGMNRLTEIVEELKREGKTIISGDIAFKLYDSMGVPLDLVEEIAVEEGLEVDVGRFNELMEQQRERGKRSWKGEGEKEWKVEGFGELKTEYTGENKYEDTGRIIALGRDGKRSDVLESGERGVVVADKTPFYGEKGGQVGDTGTIEKEDGTVFVVEDTQIVEGVNGDVIVHIGKVIQGKLSVGDVVKMKVNHLRKQEIAKHHTATHLLHRALRNVLGEHVRQMGSLVAPDRFRFDFYHYHKPTDEELEKIEEEVNRVISEGMPVEVKYYDSVDDAVKSGAVALFEDKYKKYVGKIRVIEIDDYSKELCGGTHVKNTADIGIFKIVSEGAVSSNTRRIEAVAGKSAFEHFRKVDSVMKFLVRTLNAEPDKVPDRVKSLIERTRELEKQIEELNQKLAEAKVGSVYEKAEKVNGVAVAVEKFEDVDVEGLKKIVDDFRARAKDGGVIVVAGISKGKPVIFAGVTKNLTDRFNAGELAKMVAVEVGGGGGGKPEFARAGGKDASKLPDALNKVKKFILDKLG